MPRSEAGEIEALVTAEAKRLCPGVQCQVSPPRARAPTSHVLGVRRECVVDKLFYQVSLGHSQAIGASISHL